MMDEYDVWGTVSKPIMESINTQLMEALKNHGQICW
jgi:hypothetical protein